jgi:hypothetical protein
MKRLITILMMFDMILFSVSAQLPIAKKIKTLGAIAEKPSGVMPTILKFNTAYSDTLKSGDTLFYKVPIIHSTLGYPVVVFSPKLIQAGKDTISTLTFWQSYDGVKWVQCNAVSNAYSPSAYSATVPKSTTTINEYSFWTNNIKFEGQYLGIRFIAKTRSLFKTCYYGSIRYNKGT